ncbi:uncharacterized protein LOC124675968 isoform X2 [Lolium rigidum]|uniref:uncharacterized protein LOC124675968 isoform X2 n=1 Tax=Lolium rigidum TaxID=89674 RepID=UPI001F5D1E0E|nr:uncharacterized protein LOC124675968 isoform X2 [Lolium rigidum]
MIREAAEEGEKGSIHSFQRSSLLTWSALWCSSSGNKQQGVCCHRVCQRGSLIFSQLPWTFPRVFNLRIITIMFEKSILQGLHAAAAVNVYSRALMFSGSSIAANIGGFSNEMFTPYLTKGTLVVIEAGFHPVHQKEIKTEKGSPVTSPPAKKAEMQSAIGAPSGFQPL